MSNNNPIRRRWRSQIIRERYIRLATSVGMLFFGAIIVLKVENLLLSVILAVTSSSILDPAVNSLERNGLSRKMAVSLIFLFIALILLLTIVGVLPPIYDRNRNEERERNDLLIVQCQQLFEARKRHRCLYVWWRRKQYQEIERCQHGTVPGRQHDGHDGCDRQTDNHKADAKK